MNRPLKFKDFPEIPEFKRYRGSKCTIEQEITQKIFGRQIIMPQEENTLKLCIAFYKYLIPLLKNIKFRNYNPQELLDFREYYLYVFNSLALIHNTLTSTYLYRVVRNASYELKNHQSITEVSKLKYPPLKIVQENRLYNRANNQNFNLFYGGDCLNTALRELHAEKGEVITASIWQALDPEKPITIFPIVYGQEAMIVNAYLAELNKKFSELKNRPNDALLIEYFEVVFSFLADEFSKEVTDPMEYYLSALYSERVFEKREKEWTFDGIYYPSVKNKFSYFNLALRPTYLDNNYRLSKILEIGVGETFYERKVDQYELEEISCLKPIYIREPKFFNSAKIIW